jgi:predicted dehydrogenase
VSPASSSSPAPLAVGVLGAGEIVTNLHLPTLAAMPEVTVAWIADVDVPRARRLAEAFGVPAHDQPAAPASLPPADVVLVAIPYGVREPYYEAMRGRGHALYVEKPLARTVAQHQRYCAWFAHTHLAVGYQRRASGAAAAARRLVEAAPFGPLRRARVEHGRPGQLTGSSYSGDLRLAGGGMLFEVGVHWIDLALRWCGAAAVRPQGGRMLRQDGFDLHTEATFAVERVDGPAVTLELLISGLAETRNVIELEFEHATLVFSQADGRLRLHQRGRPLGFELAHPPGRATPYQLCHAVWRGMVDGVRTGQPNWTSAESSLTTTAVVEAVYGLPS